MILNSSIYLSTYTQFTYNRLDLSFSIPKVFLRSPSYQPIQKKITRFLTHPNVGIRVPRQELSQCSLSHVSGTVYMCVTDS